ncbi:hypothetical protein [Streptomyces niveus]
MSTEIAHRQNTSLDGSVRFAQLLADADLLPRQFVGKPANVLYAVEYGRTLGITPIAAITGIHVIEGKPSASSGLIGGLVRQAGHKLRVKSDGATTATAQIIRSDDPEFVYEVTWTLERAEQAGLCQIKAGKAWARDRNGKPTSWEKYTAAMLKARAITEVARDACEDVLFGLHYTPEELGAVVNQDGEPVVAPVQQLHRVQPGETDQWATPAATVRAATADVPPESLPPGGRDYLHEAHAATDVATVRQIWTDAQAEGARPEYLEQIATVAKDKPATTPLSSEPDAADDVVDGEIVTTPEDDYAAAVAELRSAAEAARLDDFEDGAKQALGMPIADASTDAIRALAAKIRPAAA